MPTPTQPLMPPSAVTAVSRHSFSLEDDGLVRMLNKVPEATVRERMYPRAMEPSEA